MVTDLAAIDPRRHGMVEAILSVPDNMVNPRLTPAISKHSDPAACGGCSIGDLVSD
jgi:hypothetical protein